MDDHKAKGYDASLVETIVGQVKSQGLFDQFRRECLADVDTKPAFQNLRQLVENTVSKFLSKQEWTPELNKNQLREKLRRNIIDLNFLEAGVERIVDQVVTPKISTVFQPNIEEMVYKHLGIEQPKVEKLEPPGLSELSLENLPGQTVNVVETSHVEEIAPDLDLEAVSPDSNRSDEKTSSSTLAEESAIKQDPDGLNVKVEEELDEDESPPFEPIEAEVKPIDVPQPPPPEDLAIKTESQESNISGLTSQDSIQSEQREIEPIKEETDAIVPIIAKEEVECEVVAEVPPVASSPTANREDSQLSQVSSDTQNSVKYEQNTSTEEPLKMDLSEEAQMPSRFPEPERNSNNEVLISFDLQKEAITFEQAKREDDPQVSPTISGDEPSEDKAETDSQPSIEVPAEEPKPQQMLDNVCPSGEVNKIHVKANVMAEDTEESLLDSGDSMDLKIVESDSRGSVSNSNNSADTRESKKDEKSRSSSSHRKRTQHDHHRSSSSSTSQQHRSGNKSSRDKDRDRSHHRRSDKEKSSSDRSKVKKESSRKRDKEKKNGDSCREPTERRSTDRDSNDGANSGGQPKGVANGVEKTSAATSKTDNQKAPSASTSSSPKGKETSAAGQQKTEKEKSADKSSDDVPIELTDRLQQPIVVDQFLDGKELNLQMRVATPTNLSTPGSSSSPDSTKVLKKPKIAANMKEAMKLMKVRKMMDLKEGKEKERAAVELNKNYGVSDGDDKAEKNLHYFPDENYETTFKEESVSEKWWNRTKAQNEEQELVKGVKAFFPKATATSMKRVLSKEVAKEQGPPPKAPKIESVSSLKETRVKPVNGLTQTASKAKAKTMPVTDLQVDDVDDYEEAEIDLDDLSAVPLTENNNVQKENKNYELVFNKLVNGDTELELTSAAPEMIEGGGGGGVGSERAQRGPKVPVAQSQRYTSEDLYKPRPVVGRSRRSRALDGGEADGSR